MWNKTVTLYIDDTSIRLLVMQGQHIKKWAGVKLEPGLIVESVVLQESKVATRIKGLLNSQKVKTRKVVLGFSGMHSFTRPATLPRLPKSMLAEAVIREARRVLPVPLEQLYLSWTVVPDHKERTQIFMVATPRKTADSLINTLKLAGLEASRMAIKPLALTKALPLNTAILLDLQPDEFDVVILSGGTAQPIRTVALPSEELTWDQKITTLANDLTRTIKFFDANNPEKMLNTKTPIYVSGELAHKAQYQKALEETTGRPVFELTPLLKNLDKLDAGYYMVNIAMTMKTSSSINADAYEVANLNVLPIPYQPKRISLTKVTGIPGGIALAALVVPFVMMMQNTSSNINSMQQQLDTTNQFIVQKTAQRNALKKNVAELEKKAAAAKNTYDKIRKPLGNIIINQEIINGDLFIALTSLSQTVALESINEAGGELLIKGQALSIEDISAYTEAILQYARTLESSKRFSESTVTSLVVDTVNPGKSNGNADSYQKKITFTLTFTR
jgi:type IV pilus assembly protein PilM